MEKLPKINILYEDNHLLVVIKPKNIPVQKDKSEDTDLLTILKYYLKEKYNKKGDAYLGLVHRLDRPVSGIMVFAKTSKSAKRLSEQIRKNEMYKEYTAVTIGNLPKKGTLKDYLIKDNKTNITKVTDKEHGKEARLDYEVLATKNNMNLVKINLHTGRSHQIRVQFSNINSPLYGDMKYNKNVKKCENIALFANKLTFTHPTTKESLTFSYPYPNTYPYNIFTKSKI